MGNGVVYGGMGILNGEGGEISLKIFIYEKCVKKEIKITAKMLKNYTE